MTHTDIIQSSSIVAVEEAKPSEGVPAVRRSGTMQATLALVLAVAALALPLYPAIKHQIEGLREPQPWLSKQLVEVNGLAPASKPVASNADSVSLLAAVETRLADVESSLAELHSAAQQGPDTARVDAIEQGLVGVKEQLSALDTRVVTSETATKAEIARLDSLLSEKTTPEVNSLLAARLALLSVTGGLQPNDLDAIVAAAASDPAMAEAVADIKVLVEQNIPPLSMLRERFPGLAEVALAQAVKQQIGWWDSAVYTLRSTLSDIGIGRGVEATKDSMVIAETERQLDLGRLHQALFELDSGSAVLKALLAGWINAARQRLALDTALLRLVNLMLARTPLPAATAG